MSRIYADIVKVLAVGYPFLGLVYLTDRLGTFVEPIFFIAFSVDGAGRGLRTDRSGR